jgi:hypothetical protein
MGRALFMLDPDAADAVVLQYIENLKVRAAWIAKQNVDAFQRKTLSENLRSPQSMEPVLNLNL